MSGRKVTIVYRGIHPLGSPEEKGMRDESGLSFATEICFVELREYRTSSSIFLNM
jgi:hypothetical protein